MAAVRAVKTIEAFPCISRVVAHPIVGEIAEALISDARKVAHILAIVTFYLVRSLNGRVHLALSIRALVAPGAGKILKVLAANRRRAFRRSVRRNRGRVGGAC